ncbi:MAG: CoA-binding protein [Deltaproteobacteria bacterium]|nr:CoA-binding protein [Deltaproteobacteria bacterium]
MISPEADLIPFFNPRHIAIVGVSRGKNRFGGMSFMRRLQDFNFSGKLYPINPRADELQGLKAYPNLSSVPEVPDLAIVCVAARYVPAILEECGRIGLRHIHIFSAGFKEIGTKEGKELERQVVSISKENGLLVIGPNCMGPYCPSAGLTAWGALPGMSGPLGVISQSGGITQRLTEYAYSLGIGVEKAVSFGNAAVLDSTDYLKFMAEDEKIRVIAMYLESVKDGQGFLELAREVSQKKPIIIWKGGETEAGARTVASHTGTMAGKHRLWEAFFRQAGAMQVHSMNEWADAVTAFCLLPAPEGKSIFLVGGGGGNSVSYSDICIREGLDVPPLSETTMESLRQSVPVAGSIAGNPLDMWRTFEDPEYLAEVLALGYRDPYIDMIIIDRLIPRLAFHMDLTSDMTLKTIEFIKKKGHQKPTVFTVDSDGGDPDLAVKGTAQRAEFCKAGIPAYPSLSRAAKALAHLCRYYTRETNKLDSYSS